MTGKREAKKTELKAKLIAAASELIEAGGISALNARAVTKKAGCALGSLYTLFDDLDELIVYVNSQTLHNLADSLKADFPQEGDSKAILKSLALSYVTFARENFASWNALFEYADFAHGNIPDWHEKEQAMLINFIKGPVLKLSPQIGEEEAMIRARTLFAAVHGIVAFSMQRRFIGLDEKSLEPELMRFIDQMIAGLGK